MRSWFGCRLTGCGNIREISTNCGTVINCISNERENFHVFYGMHQLSLTWSPILYLCWKQNGDISTKGVLRKTFLKAPGSVIQLVTSLQDLIDPGSNPGTHKIGSKLKTYFHITPVNYILFY